MGRIKWNVDLIKEYASKYNIELLSTEYKNNREKLKFKCSKGHVFERSLDKFLKNQSCIECNKLKPDKKLLEYEEVKKYIESYNFKLLSKEYKGANKPLLMECNHGHKFNRTFGNFKSKNKICPICKKNAHNHKNSYTYDQVKEYIESFGFKLISKKYIDCKTPLIVKCPKHGKWEVTFDNFKNSKSRCPKCKNSKGEEEINKILNKYNINFISQYSFENCKHKRHLKFDFYIPSQNTCIEYDGEFHYRITTRNSKEDYDKQLLRDEIKNNFCKDNNIRLIRIPYWEKENLEKILIKELNL